MNKTKNSKIVLVLSVFLIFLIIGSASAAEDTDEIGNETILTSQQTGVDTVNNAVDEEVSAAETDSFGSDDANNQNNLLKSNVDEVVLKSSTIDVKTYDGLKNALDDNDISEININDDLIFSGVLNLKSNLIIYGNGHTLDAQNKSCIFQYKKVGLENVTIKNVNFINANISRSYGCFIHIQACTNITIENCNFTNGSGGSAVAFTGGSRNVTIKNCNFINNNASNSGGAMNFNHQSKYPDGSDFHNNTNVINCNFIDNYATIMGGACEFYCMNSLLENCSFIRNHALGYAASGTYNGQGGAFNLYRGAENFTIRNVFFINNTATLYGGAFASNSDDCKYTNIINCTFIGNKAQEGGAIKYSSNNTTMIDCIFVNNTATVDGGAICSRAMGSIVENCSFINNSATKGMDFYAHDGCKITFSGLKFTKLWLQGNNTDNFVTSGHGISWDNPASWDDLNQALTFLDTSSGKATIYHFIQKKLILNK